MITLLLLWLSALCLAEGFFGKDRSVRRRVGFGAAGAMLGLLWVVACWRWAGGAQTFAYLLMPAGALWLIGVAACALLHARRARWARNCVGILWLIYSAAGSTFVGHVLLRPVESDYESVDPFAASYDVVHVLGGGTRNNGPYSQLGASGDRVMLGARLWHQGHTPLLLTTGSTPQSSYTQHNSAQTTAKIWEDVGIPSEAVLVEPAPTNTYQEMMLLKSLQEQYGWERIGVVSSARHLRRVMQNAARAEVEILPLPADYRASTGGVIPSFGSLVPTAAGFSMVHHAAWEWLARVVNH